MLIKESKKYCKCSKTFGRDCSKATRKNADQTLHDEETGMSSPRASK